LYNIDRDEIYNDAVDMDSCNFILQE
jgi:hypothetical protein